MLSVILSSSRWAKRELGSVDLGDHRRNKRSVAMATHLVQNLSASLPAQMGSPKALKAASIRWLSGASKAGQNMSSLTSLEPRLKIITNATQQCFTS